MPNEKVALTTSAGDRAELIKFTNAEGVDTFTTKLPGKGPAVPIPAPTVFKQSVDIINAVHKAHDATVEQARQDVKQFTNIRYRELVELAYKADGSGSYINPVVTFLGGLDRFHHNILPPHTEHTGYTFITRPRLCFKDANLRRDSCFAPLLTSDPMTLGFMLRAMLDTKYSKDNSTLTGRSPLMNFFNAFFVPLCNAMTSISGWPDPYLDTFTTSTGFHGEDQTFAIGSNRLSATYDLSLTFKDVPLSPIAYLLFYWRLYIDHVCKGTMLAYPDDIDNHTLNYTVSIYRFVFDSSYKYITKYAKATGCFPKAIPMGDMMNINEGEILTTSGAKFTIPFIANKVEYNDPRIFLDFNRLSERYCPDITNPVLYENLSNSPITNFHAKAIPYLEANKSGVALVYRAPVTTDISEKG
jgi:hypothetical protein